MKEQNPEIEQAFFKFLAKAHKNTYAAPSEIRSQHKMSTPFLPGHKCYYFKEGEWEYYDGYAGKVKAPGGELVLLRGKPFWRMSYQGRLADSPPACRGNQGLASHFFSEEFLQEQAFPFLRRSLMNFDENMPFRGPSHYSEGDLTYEFEMEGDYTYFTARETLSFRGFKLFFQDVMGETII